MIHYWSSAITKSSHKAFIQVVDTDTCVKDTYMCPFPHWFSECAHQTSRIIWELDRNANSQVLLQTYRIRKSRTGPVICIWTSSPSNDACPSREPLHEATLWFITLVCNKLPYNRWLVYFTNNGHIFGFCCWQCHMVRSQRLLEFGADDLHVFS